MTPAYTLDDAEGRASANPRTFLIPDQDERRNLRPGQFAKLIFLAPEDLSDPPRPGGERMWVRVVRRLDDGAYVGRLDNDPLFIDIEPGDTVRFEARHVCQVFALADDAASTTTTEGAFHA